VTQTLKIFSPVALLGRKRANALRRAETVGNALERLVATREYPNVFKRHKMLLQSVANLTLAIEAVRLAESREVKVLGH
jgi:hypothetical protein